MIYLNLNEKKQIELVSAILNNYKIEEPFRTRIILMKKKFLHEFLTSI